MRSRRLREALREDFLFTTVHKNPENYKTHMYAYMYVVIYLYTHKLKTLYLSVLGEIFLLPL